MEINVGAWNGYKQEQTKAMPIAEGNCELNIEIEGDYLEQIHDFEYLGITVEAKGKEEIEINKKLTKAMKP